MPIVLTAVLIDTIGFGIVMPVFPALITWLGERRAVVVGLSCGATAFLAYAFVAYSWQAYALFLVSALSGFVFPSMNGLLSRMADPTRQGALQGWLGSMGSVAAIISPILLTQALAAGVERGFPGAAFLLAALLAFVSRGIVVWRVLNRVPKRSDEVAEA